MTMHAFAATTLLFAALSLVPLAGCAEAELPGADAGLSGEAGTPDTGHLDGPPSEDADASDVDSQQDAGADAQDTDVCVRYTCEELSACGSVDDGCGSTLECDACVDPGEIAEVVVTPAGNQVLGVGEELDLEATARRSDGTEVLCNIEWSSQNPTVARVDATGAVRGVAAGISNVSAGCHGHTDEVRVYVNDSGLADDLLDPGVLRIWLRADAGISRSGTSVTAWEDLSGNGFTVAAGSSFSNQPGFITGALNDHPVLRFTGHQDMRTSGEPESVAQATIFVVAKNTAADHRGQLLSNCGDGGNNQLRYDGTSTDLYFYGEESGLDTSVSLSSPTTEFRLLSVVLSGSQLQVFVDGQQGASEAVSTGGDWHVGQVGARCSSEQLEAELAEIMVYDGALSDAQRDQVEQYLIGRYRL